MSISEELIALGAALAEEKALREDYRRELAEAKAELADWKAAFERVLAFVARRREDINGHGIFGNRDAESAFLEVMHDARGALGVVKSQKYIRELQHG